VTARWTSPNRSAQSAWPRAKSSTNLIFVINCNLQRLDGPVRGNGKIIQELEGEFRGSGWNVIKLLWGGYWDPLLARDKDEILRKVMMDTVDGDYQAFKANDGPSCARTSSASTEAARVGGEDEATTTSGA